MPTINPMPMIRLEIEAANASHAQFEETIKDLPADKQAVLRALRQIAFAGRSPYRYTRSSIAGDSCGGSFLLGFLLGETL